LNQVLITGGNGFLGRNLAAHLAERKDCEMVAIDVEDSEEALQQALATTEVVFHLAGVNRPQDPAEYNAGNTQFTEEICDFLRKIGRTPLIVFSSSIQATLDNPYGLSKRRAEEALRKFSSETGARVRIYRLKNLFGKWGRPNYNSVVATLCHNVANDLPIHLSDPANAVELSYVDDVVAAFIEELEGSSKAPREIPSTRILLGDLAGRIQAFHEMHETLVIPDFSDAFNRALYATYLSYVPQPSREQRLHIRSDNRGSLGEFVKQAHLGQIFVSRTHPGITRGNHYHHTKTEKFLVVEGEGLIRMRSIFGGPVHEYAVKGEAFQVIDIPPGWTHSITNSGSGEMVTLFWSSEIFDPDRPDTYSLPVDFKESPAAAMERSRV
jgi:UDP-2-acetamido-2,6-beta-L-arabino-hexul-4-ose reductase